MTAVEWLIKIYLQTNKIDSFDIEQAKEMEKNQIIGAYQKGRFNYEDWNKGIKKNLVQSEQYYNETYGSKGSDDQVSDVRKMVDNWDNVFDKIESEYDCHIPLKVVNYLNKYYKVPTSSQTEISDEEINKVMQPMTGMHEFYKAGFVEGAKWYREQLKSKH